MGKPGINGAGDAMKRAADANGDDCRPGADEFADRATEETAG